MGRLMPGESEKIDNINRLVALSHSMNDMECSKALDALLTLFKPMILKLCTKWSGYFRDESHKLIPWDILISDANFWFIYYTTKKYSLNGSATYNKFIKDHMDQRIRYIYETELKYAKNTIFPDPDKNGNDNNCVDMLEEVINRYSSSNEEYTMDDIVIMHESEHDKGVVCKAILTMMNNRNYFNEREYLIFTECIMNGRTHDDISKQLKISRTRVSQIMGRMKKKISDILDDEVRGWEEIIK